MSDRSKCQWIALSRRRSYTDARPTAAVNVLSALKKNLPFFSFFPFSNLGCNLVRQSWKPGQDIMRHSPPLAKLFIFIRISTIFSNKKFSLKVFSTVLLHVWLLKMPIDCTFTSSQLLRCPAYCCSSCCSICFENKNLLFFSFSHLHAKT